MTFFDFNFLLPFWHHQTVFHPFLEAVLTENPIQPFSAQCNIVTFRSPG